MLPSQSCPCVFASVLTSRHLISLNEGPYYMVQWVKEVSLACIVLTTSQPPTPLFGQLNHKILRSGMDLSIIESIILILQMKQLGPQIITEQLVQCQAEIKRKEFFLTIM